MKKIIFVLLACSLVFSPLAVFAQGKEASAGAASVSDERIQQLIAQLGDDNAAKRTEATDELKKIGKPALPLLEKAAAEASDPEIRVRVKSIIKWINNPPKQEAPMGGVDPKELLGGLGGGGAMGDMLSGLLGGMGGEGGGDIGGLIGGLLGGAGGGGGGGDLLGMLLGGLSGMGGAPSGPQFVLMPPTGIKEGGKNFVFSHKVVIVVEVTEIKDGKEVKRIVYADNEDELKEKDPEAYKIYSKLIRAQLGK